MSLSFLKIFGAASLLLFGGDAVLYAQNKENSNFKSEEVKGLEADAAYYDALRARLKGDDKEEERLLLQVISGKPQASGAYYDLARLYFKENRSDKAIEYIKKAIALDGSCLLYTSRCV